jgi:hypothetical protein
MNKTLSKEEITKLLRNDSRPTPWPSENDLKLLARAFKAGEDTVTLADKREYSIRYKESYDAVFVKPTDGKYVPCGWINVKTFKGIR